VQDALGIIAIQLYAVPIFIEAFQTGKPAMRNLLARGFSLTHVIGFTKALKTLIYKLAELRRLVSGRNIRHVRLLRSFVRTATRLK
jgi:hypothetical protein